MAEYRAEKLVGLTGRIMELVTAATRSPLPGEVQGVMLELMACARELHKELGGTIPISTPPGGSPRLLLVEDNPFNRTLMAKLLESRGFVVTTLEHGGKALELLRANHSAVDLVLMNLRMPVLDGFEAARAIRDLERERGYRPLPIIAVSALTAEPERQRVVEAGFTGFHAKPVKAEELFAEIERVLAKSATPEPFPPPASPALIVGDRNVEQLLKSVDGDWGLLREICELYFGDAPRQLERIRFAIIQGDAQGLREAAHSLKGASGVFGKSRIHDLSFELEQMGRNHDLTDALERLHQLEAAVEEMRLKLEPVIQR